MGGARPNSTLALSDPAAGPRKTKLLGRVRRATRARHSGRRAQAEEPYVHRVQHARTSSHAATT